MAVVANFLDHISCQESITWSNDHRISIATDKYIRCLMTKCDCTSTENKVGFLQSSIPVEGEILDIPQFSQSQHFILINGLPREDFKFLSTDRVLNPMKYTYDSVPHTGFFRSEWSPATLDGLFQRSILATLSFDRRLCLYWQKDSQYYWYKICDLTELRLAKTRIKMKTIEDYYPYKDWCFSQAVTSMKWFPEVLTDAVSGNKFLLLAAGMQSGHVVLWKICWPCENMSECQDACSDVCTIQPRHNQIHSLQWSSKLGMLVMGYQDGQIHGLHVDLQDLSKTPDCTCLYGESSLLKPAAMCFLDSHQDETYVLVVSAEHCALAFHLSSDGRTVISQDTLILQNEFPSVGMYPLTSDSLLMMSHDVILQKLVITRDDKGVQLRNERIPIEFPAESPCVCHGFCLSPNKMFAAFVIRISLCNWFYTVIVDSTAASLDSYPGWTILSRPWPSYDHHDKKHKNVTTMVYVQCLDDFLDGSNCRGTCLQCLINTEEPLGNMIDVLELYRLQIYTDRNNDIEKEGISELRYNQLQSFTKRVQVVKLQNKVRVIEDDGESIEERLEKDIHRLTCSITAHWINEAWQNILSLNITYTHMSESGRLIIRAMLIFLEKRSDVLVDCEGVTTTREAMRTFLFSETCIVSLKCCVCNENLQLEWSSWKCSNEHEFSICRLTCLPVEGVEYCMCPVCHNLTRPSKECTWLAWDQTRCLFCESMIFA